MAHLSKDGRFIISAGEVAAYTVCPESWRLRTVAKVSTSNEANIAKGKELHKKWVENFDESLYLARNARLVLLLFLIALGAFLLMV